MPTINQLSTSDTVEDGDKLPFFSEAQGDTRAVTFATFKDSVSDTLVSKADLAAQTGATLVGCNGGTTVQQELTALSASVAGAASSADLASTDSNKGGSLVGFKQSGTGAVDSTVSAKLREIVSVADFGAVGDGVADDTAEIQAAINTGAAVVKLLPSKTYLIDGGLSVSTAGQRIEAYGATIKLKNSASNKGMLSLNASGASVAGGTWDGNQANGNVSSFGAFAVGIFADKCSVSDITSNNSGGIGVKAGNCSDWVIDNVTVRGTLRYGVYGEATTTNVARVRVSNCNIDTSAGGVNGQGILLASSGGFALSYYEITGNTITGPTGALTSQAINIAVRGNNGVVSHNITRYGAMGFSEGGNNCIVSNNQFLDLEGSSAIGIEPSGTFVATGNVITGALRGIAAQTTASFDGSVISGNYIYTLNGSNKGIVIQVAVGQTGKNIVISGNTIYGARGVETARTIDGILITGNKFVGFNAAVDYAIYFDTPSAAVYANVIGNSFTTFFRPWTVYSLAATTFTNLYATNNDTSQNIGAFASWYPQGSAVLGANCKVIGSSSGIASYQDVASNIFEIRGNSYNNPEGLFAAGIGSTFYSTNSTGGAYFKVSGTGATGWRRMDQAVVTDTAANIAAIASTINTTGKFAGRLVFDTTNNRLMVASGSTAASAWYVADGSASVVPA